MATEVPVTRVAVLQGGTSAEREVSLMSGAAVSTALATAGFTVTRIDTAEPGWLRQIEGVDVVFNALHGPGGEDGVIQGALKVLGIPCTGSGVLGCALAMDKQRSKQLWLGAGLPTAAFTPLTGDTDWQAVIATYGKVFVKPVYEGSSVGMAPADSADSLQAAWRAACHYSPEVFAEQFIDGPEYTVAVLGDRALPSIRLEPKNEFYDYEAKYLSDETVYHCPSGLDASGEARIGRLALAAFHALGCSVWGRVDIMRDADGGFYLLEVNTIPGMTSHSLVPMAARAAGMEMPALVRRIVELSLAEVQHG